SVNRTANAHYLRIKVESPAQGFGLVNEGFHGVGIEKDAEYIFSLKARRVEGEPAAVRAELEDGAGHPLGQTSVTGFGREWKTFTSVIRSTGTDSKAHFNLLIEGRGTLDVDSISLFPKATWQNRPNGLRPDLVRLLKEMKPGFLRFPGGCIVEGSILE